MSYCAVGPKYGVSDNAIRRWIRWCEHDRQPEAHASGDASQHEPPDTIAA
jgi:transposase-like protein